MGSPQLMWLFWMPGVLALAAAAFLLARRLHAARGHAARLGARLAAVLAARGAGLAVWSRDGRLVACNPRFREFYPDVPIRPGVELEDLVRATVTRGLVQVPEAEVEGVGAGAAGGRPRGGVRRGAHRRRPLARDADRSVGRRRDAAAVHRRHRRARD